MTKHPAFRLNKLPVVYPVDGVKVQYLGRAIEVAKMEDFELRLMLAKVLDTLEQLDYSFNGLQHTLHTWQRGGMAGVRSESLPLEDEDIAAPLEPAPEPYDYTEWQWSHEGEITLVAGMSRSDLQQALLQCLDILGALGKRLSVANRLLSSWGVGTAAAPTPSPSSKA